MPKKVAKKQRKSQYDLGETWHSCSGIHCELLYHVSPKSHKYKSQHWRVNIWAPCPRKHQKQRKSQCDLGETLHSCSGVHLETLYQVSPKSHNYKSQHWRVNISAPNLRKHQKQRKSQCDLGGTLHSCSGIHLEPLCQVSPKSDKYKSHHWRVNIRAPRSRKHRKT